MTSSTTSVFEAVDRYLDALRGYFMTDINTEGGAAFAISDPNGRVRSDLRQFIEAHCHDALAQPRAALYDNADFAALPQETKDSFGTAVAVVFDVFVAQNPGVGFPWYPAPGNNTFGSQIEAARAVIYRACCDNPSRAEVSAAAERFTAVQSERDAAITALNDAVRASDLETIASLRPTVSVELPAKIDEARQALLDAEAAAAVAECAPFLDRQARVEKAADDAAKALDKARQALVRAEARKLAADNLLPATEEATVTARRIADAAVTARDTHAASLEAERVRRVRSFAGV